MSTLINTLAGRLREFVGDRRRVPRRQSRVYAQLPFTVVLLDTQEEAAKNAAGKNSLAGHTRDLSATGLTLLLSVMRIGDSYLTDSEHYLGIRLSLPGGPVSMLAAPVRFEHATGTESEPLYLLGVRILNMREDDRSCYLTYLSTLLTKDRRVRNQTRDGAQASAPPAPILGQANALANITPAHINEAFERFLR
jgi:hypothetical protein